MFRCAVHITEVRQAEKKKPPCLNRIRQCGFVFCGSLSAYLFESASHIRSIFCPGSRLKSSRSRFDKFNHVKYTKTLSVRNWHTAFSSLFFRRDKRNFFRAFQIAIAAHSASAQLVQAPPGFIACACAPNCRHVWPNRPSEHANNFLHIA